MTETEKELLILPLYTKYYEYLKKAAYIHGANPMDAEDFVQDVFLLAVQKADILMRRKDPRVWLVKVLANHMRNYRRRHENRFNCSLEEYGDFPAPKEVEPLWHILPSQFSESEQQLLIWRFEEGISYKEMSRRLGISENYCRVKLCRLFKKYRELMGI